MIWGFCSHILFQVRHAYKIKCQKYLLNHRKCFTWLNMSDKYYENRLADSAGRALRSINAKGKQMAGFLSKFSAPCIKHVFAPYQIIVEKCLAMNLLNLQKRFTSGQPDSQKPHNDIFFVGDIYSFKYHYGSYFLL